MKVSWIKICWLFCSGRLGVKRKLKDLSDEFWSKVKCKCSLKYYGVCFKRGFGKYVVEFCVLEWKVVDKKIWFGMYEKEEGVVWVVDFVRKFLKCKKIRFFNLLCDEFDNWVMLF